MEDGETVRLHAVTGPYKAGATLCAAGALCGLAVALSGNLVGLVSGLTLAVTLGGVACLCLLAPRPGEFYLDLTPEGLREVCVRSTSRTLRWDQVESFVLLLGSEGGDLIGFRYADGHPARKRRRGRSSAARPDGCLRDNYGLSPRDLLDTLDAWRRRHGPKPSVCKEPADDLA